MRPLDEVDEVSEVVAVVPAAGASRRMGRPKLLLPWGGGAAAGGTVAGGTVAGGTVAGGSVAGGSVVGESTVGGSVVVGSVVAALLAGGAQAVALVVAPAGAPGAAELAAWGRERGLQVTENPRPERGMLSSVRCGLAALGDAVSSGSGGAAALARRGAALLVTPADLPALLPSTVAAVTAALRSGAALAVPVHAGRRGHPLGIAPRLLPEIDDLDLAAGLRQLVERHADVLAEVPVDDPGCVHDVDTPEDYRRLAAEAISKR